jgi:hypothetical protein
VSRREEIELGARQARKLLEAQWTAEEFTATISGLLEIDGGLPGFEWSVNLRDGDAHLVVNTSHGKFRVTVERLP